VSVTYSNRAVLRQWEQYDYSGLLLGLRVPGATQEALLIPLTDAVQEANAAAEEADERVRGREPWRGRRVPLVSLSWCDSKDGLLFWLDKLTSALDHAGLEGTLTPASFDYPPTLAPRGERGALSAMLFLSGWTVNGENRARPVWMVDEAVRDRLMNWAIPWTADGRAELYVGVEETSFLLPVEAARDHMGASDYLTLCVNPDLDHLRWVCFDSSGRMTVQVRDTDRTWQSNLAEIRSVLVQFADLIEYAGVRMGHAAVASARGLIYPGHRWPPQFPSGDPTIDASYYYLVHRGLDTERVPDAYGLQVLTDAHLARAHDLSQWRVEPFGTGHRLVTAQDQAAWFAQDVPIQRMVDQARADLGPKLILLKTPPSQPAST
jgi:hypothetical protein